MAELTIVFRLRFAVALAAALTVVLAFNASDASSQETTASEYIVQMHASATPAQGQQMVLELGGQLTSPELPVINGFGAMLEDDAAEELENRAGVAEVSLNAVASSDPTSGATGEGLSGTAACPYADATTRPGSGAGSINDVGPLNSLSLLRQPLQYALRVDKAWMRASGRGVGVAVIDTGIAGDLPDFVTSGKSRVIASAVTNPCAKNANDQVGHGTHVAGLIAGNSLNHPGLKKLTGRYMGIAPRANLISVKVSDDDGAATVLDVIYGIQFAVDHKTQLGIRVINLSLSSTVAESYLTDPLDAAVEAAWFSGIVVVAASGNDGTAADAVSYAPGNDPFVITAGALDDRGTKSLDDDVLAPWSSRGLTQDGVRKPEVLAPGTRLVAALAPRSDFEELCRSCMIGRTYFRLSGTSMASAVVSGVAALVIQHRPHLTPNEVKGAIVASMRNVPGAGAAVDANAALDATATANAGLVPSGLLDPATGLIDWTRVSFRRVSFRSTSDSPYPSTWAGASFGCDCGLDSSGAVDSNRVSFRRVSFRRTVDFDR